MERNDHDRHRNTVRRRARRWWDCAGDSSKRLVNPIFRLLGAVSVVDEYLKTGETSMKTPSEPQLGRLRTAYLCARAAAF